MRFEVTKAFRPTKNIHPIIVALLWVIAIPIFIIVLVLGVVSITFHNIKKLFVKESRLSQKQIDQLNSIKHRLNNGSIHLELFEDRFDEDYLQMCDRWYKDVHDEDCFIYKIRTTPSISDLDGKVVTSFLKETDKGAFIQTVDNVTDDDQLKTLLMFLSFADLRMRFVEEVGPYFLYLDKSDPNIIRGFNRQGDIELSVTEKNGM